MAKLYVSGHSVHMLPKISSVSSPPAHIPIDWGLHGVLVLYCLFRRVVQSQIIFPYRVLSYLVIRIWDTFD